jgi:hypothetical protein
MRVVRVNDLLLALTFSTPRILGRERGNDWVLLDGFTKDFIWVDEEYD